MKDNPKRNALQVIQPTRCPCSFSTASSRRNHGGLKSSPSREGPEASRLESSSFTDEPMWMQRRPSNNPIEQADEKPASRSRQEWPGIQQRSIIALVLCFCAMLLATGPAAYCWLNHAGRADMADVYRGGAHPTEENSCCAEATPGAHHRPVLYIGSDYVNEVASGGINGLLMMVATVVAGIGIDLPGPHILAMGSASLISYGFSMGFGAFMVEEAKEGFARSQLEEEYNEVRAMPSAEVDEMICHYRKRGLSEEDARHVAKIFSKYEDFWVHHMMAEELGIQLPRGPTAAMKSGLATGTSFLIFGLVPLLGLVISTCLRSCAGPAWYRPQFSTAMSLTLSAFALLLLGSLVSRLVGSRTPLVSGMTMLANGFAASIMAFAVSQLLSTEMEKKALGAKVSEVDEVPQPVAKRCPKRLRLDSGSSQPGSGVQMSEPGAWPTFRHQFFLSSFMLWVAVCSAIVAWQTFSRAYVAFERMHWEVIRVFGYGLLTCVTTGLGAVPFLVVKPGPLGIGLAVANAVAAGMMLAASASMVFEAHEHCGTMDWQLFVGLGAGALFIRASERLHGVDEEEEEGIAALHDALLERKQWRKAMLIFTVMFCHSAAEGIAVGVAFSRQLNHEFGIYISLLLAVHNVPEGLAVALVLVPRGVSATLAAFIATLTSVPQPVLALAAFLFVEVFQGLLPIGLAFSAGAMVYVCLHELLVESMEQLGFTKAVLASSLSFGTMSACIFLLQSITGL
ncbi:unnamed protein product [Durusdinium trenchii]|uniref:Uncharacterized protein n=1 Tax=Durusdinium trenchii TaxID=1381693 RepID=A0ABP0P2I3_9DINO